jgi:hypothetical protein
MANPYTAPPAASGPTPKWARKRYVLPALALALFIGVGIGNDGGEDTKTDAKPVTAKPQPTVTVTATATVAAESEPEPAETVTATETVKVTKTVTAEPAAEDGSDTGSDVYYANCSEARAAGAAPIHRGEPGYASHLDRDNDGVGCDS